MIVVIGDIILDQYIWGFTERIAPEAPVPVIDIITRSSSLGGAGNVAQNLKCLNNDVFLIGLTGIDNKTEKIQKKLAKNNIFYNLITPKDFSTITKTRVFSDSKMVLRIDKEDKKYKIDKNTKKTILKCLLRAINSSTGDSIKAVILSDYNKGLFNGGITHDIISMCAIEGKNIPVLVDPKKSSFTSYTGCRLIKPNLKEFNLMSGCDFKKKDIPEKLTEIKNKAIEILNEYKIDSMLITMSEKGMVYIDIYGGYIYQPAKKINVFDVTGAGDTVIAVLASTRNNEDINQQIKLASKAAGIVINKAGVAPITYRELNEGE